MGCTVLGGARIGAHSIIGAGALAVTLGLAAGAGAQVLELGPLNASIHQIDECVAVADLDLLSDVYQRILEKLLA